MDLLKQIAESVFSKLQFEHALILILGLALALIVYTVWFVVLRVSKMHPPSLKESWADYRQDRGVARRFGKRIKDTVKLIFRTFYWVVFPRKIQYFIVLIFVLVTSMLFLLHFFGVRPYVVAQFPAADKPWQNMREPLVLVFDKPIKKDNLVLNMAPEVPGRTEFVPSFPSMPDLGLYRKVVFYPDQTIEPDRTIIVYAVGIENISGIGDKHEANVDFLSGKVPDIESVTLPDNAIDVPTRPQILITLTEPMADFVEWDVSTEPSSQIEKHKQTDSSFLLDFALPLEQTRNYKLVIKRREVVKNLVDDSLISASDFTTVKTINFTTLKAPLTKEILPQGTAVIPTAKIVVNFDLPMDRASVEERFKLEPETAGTFEWNDSSDQLTFIPDEPLPKDTQFNMEIAIGALSQKGGILEQSISHSFRTVGAIQITAIGPGNGNSDVPLNTSVIVGFNQEINKDSFGGKFSISPALRGTITWEGNTMTFKLQENMRAGTKYTVDIAAGLESVHGLPLTETISFSFTTTGESFLLAGVPQYFQAERFTCNVAAMRMALAYRGVHLSEGQIKAGLGVGQPLNGSTGGDPYNDWVDGHGVYWPAASSFLSNYRVNAVRRNWNIPAMLREVRNGNPVIVWWQNGWGAWEWKSWTTPGGYQVSGLNGMHSEVVVGYRGPIDNPNTIITRDPWRGTRYYSRSSFDSLWNNSFGRTAIVVY